MCVARRPPRAGAPLVNDAEEFTASGQKLHALSEICREIRKS
jgi:hypothetical protein